MVGLLIAVGSVGCNPPKDPPICFVCGGDDTASGDDTGQSDPPAATRTGTNEPVRCALEKVSDSNFGAGNYADATPPGHECRCVMDYEHDASLGFPPDNKLWMWVRGDGADNTLKRPEEAAFDMPWGNPLFNDNPTNYDGRTDRWTAQVFQTFSDPYGLDGTYTFYLSEKRSNGNFDDSCDTHAWNGTAGQVQVEIGFNLPGGSPPPAGAPARPQSPNGYEDDMDCDASESGTTTFELLDVPHTGLAAPVPVDGTPLHAGADAVTVEVLDWRGADELTIEGPNQSVLIEPGDGEVTLPTGDWWIGTLHYVADRKDSAGTFKHPLIRIDHACPSTPAGSTASVPVGYGLSLDDLADAVEDATGWTSLADILLDAEYPTWPVYAVRMVDIDRPAPLDDLPVLRLEVRGTDHALHFPVVETGSDSWSFDYDWDYYAAEGTLTRSGTTLTLSVTDGVLHGPNGDVDIDPFSIVVSEL